VKVAAAAQPTSQKLPYRRSVSPSRSLDAAEMARLEIRI